MFKTILNWFINILSVVLSVCFLILVFKGHTSTGVIVLGFISCIMSVILSIKCFFLFNIAGMLLGFFDFILCVVELAKLL